MVETRKKREPIEPDDLVEYRNIKKKRKKETVALQRWLRGKGRPLRGKGESRRLAIRRG